MPAVGEASRASLNDARTLSLLSRSRLRHHLIYSCLQVDLARVQLQEARHLRGRRHRRAPCELQRHDPLPQALPVGNGRVGLVTPGGRKRPAP